MTIVLSLSQRMDRERRHADARLTNRKPRLMEMAELPAWITRDPKELENALLDQEALDLYGRGTRQRKEVDYSDSLTEKEWLRVRTSSAVPREFTRLVGCGGWHVEFDRTGQEASA